MDELIKICKNSVTLRANRHKNIYKTVEEYLDYMDEKEDVAKDILKEMIKRDTMIEIQFYNISATAFYTVYHYDYNEAIKECHKIIKGN